MLEPMKMDYRRNRFGIFDLLSRVRRDGPDFSVKSGSIIIFSTNFHAVIFSMNFAFEVGSLLVRNKLVPLAKKKSI